MLRFRGRRKERVRGICGKIRVPRDEVLAGNMLFWNTEQPECQLSDLPSQGIHSTGRNLRDTLDCLPGLMCASLLPKAAVHFGARLNGCCQKKWSPRRSAALIASSPPLWGTMTRVSVTCHVPSLTQELGCLQRKWRLIATHALGPVLIPQGSGFCSNSRFYSQPRRVLYNNQKGFKNIKMDTWSGGRKMKQGWTQQKTD